MKYLKILLAGVLASAAWAALAFYGGVSGWWLDAMAEEGDAAAFMSAAKDMVDKTVPGSVAFALIENGEVFDMHYRGTDRSIDGNTLFATASLSKWPAAYGVMLLVQEGKVDLDAPVSDYLTRWQLPESDFDNSGVTVGRLLSHTAGLTDGLGWGDYEPDETLPTLVESLKNPRESDGAQVEIKVGQEPGSGWNYSGGGYLILELLVEEVSGQPFDDYMQQAVFDPIGMTRSTYAYLAEQDNIAGSYQRNGEPATLYRYAAKSATGLNTSVNDMVRFALAQLDENAPLSQANVALMREPRGYETGFAIWGTGPMLHSPDGEGDFIFGHDGANSPSINATVRVNPSTGDGIVALSTGPAYMGSRIAFQWGLWNNGYPDFIQSNIAIDSAKQPMFIGIGLIAVFTLMLLFRRYRQ